MPVQSDILDEMNRLIDAASAQQIFLRVIGGLAVRVHSGDYRKFFTREYPDIDFVTTGKDRRNLEPFFKEMGYGPNKQFNLLNGANRQIYYDDSSGRRVDIFVGDFQMCHKLPMNSRLHIHPITIPLAELVLSKAQIFELNRKDALDIASILLYNETSNDDAGVNLDTIAKLCSQDWGLYKTTSINLQRVEDVVKDKDLNLTNEERNTILTRINKIRKTFEDMPKSIPWQMRDKVGTRVRWYEEVEEVAR